MAWTTDYRVSNIEFNGNVIGGVQSNSIAANAERRRDVANNSLYARSASLVNMSPVGRFTTLDIAGALGAFGVDGLCIDAGTGPFDNYYQLQGCEGPESGFVHLKYTITEGILFPISLNVTHRGDVQITYEIRARWDGINDPVIKTPNVEIPAAPNADARFGMGQVDMPNIPVTALEVIEGKRSINIDFNASASSAGADSEEFDSVQSLDAILPTITILGVDLAWLDDVVAPILGRSLFNANPLNIYLKKQDVPIATPEHIKLTAQGLIYWDSIVDGSIGQAASNAFALDAIAELTNTPITVDLASTHP